ncbi:MAG TPA: hypothetical protein VNQ79_27815 [Blastocatellia bacterium]|nr:hypothetical protein [Blastocatellia bacterium]
MPEPTDNYFNQRSGILALWAGLLAGPLAWALAQQVGYLFVTLDCSYEKTLLLSPVMLVALLMAASGALISWRNWQRAGGELPDEGGTVISRSRFMAVVGLLLSSLALLLVIAEWLPVFFYRQCQR